MKNDSTTENSNQHDYTNYKIQLSIKNYKAFFYKRNQKNVNKKKPFVVFLIFLNA